jgi:hypothetical protein
MPGTLETTEPAPVPCFVTMSSRNTVCWLVKRAVTCRDSIIVMVQGVAAVVHELTQPSKVDPGAGVAVRVTMLPGS